MNELPSKLLLIAIQEIQRSAALRLEEAINAAAEYEGRDPSQWKFDGAKMKWVEINKDKE